MQKITFLYTTFATKDDAVKTIKTLMDEKLVTCGNISAPHTAVYPWKDEVKEDQEIAVFLKAPLHNKESLIKKLKSIHPYELPCILDVDASAIPGYAAWLENP